MKKKIYDIVFAAQYEGLSTKEATDQLLVLFGVVGQSEQFTCSCIIPPAIRLCEGVETCLKCGDKLSK